MPESRENGIQAAPVEADLPDPLDAVGGESAASADDLLAQMAGEAIDRLLAEAEEGAASSHLPAAGYAGADEPPVDQQLDRLFSELNESGSLPAAAGGDADPAATAAEAETDPAVDPPDPESQPELDDEDSSAEAEREALELDTRSLATAAAAALDDPAGATRPSLFVRVLELLNAPLAGCSPSVHQAIGRVAIITLLNAVAVILYVLLLR